MENEKFELHLKRMAEFMAAMLKRARTKGEKYNDFTKNPDPFANYIHAASKARTTTQQLILSRAQEKVDRLDNMLANPEKFQGDPEDIDEVTGDIMIQMAMIRNYVRFEIMEEKEMTQYAVESTAPYVYVPPPTVKEKLVEGLKSLFTPKG